MPCRTPAGTWGVAKCSLYISKEVASSRDRQDKRFPPSGKTLSAEGKALPPERAVLSGSAAQPSRASRLGKPAVFETKV